MAGAVDERFPCQCKFPPNSMHFLFSFFLRFFLMPCFIQVPPNYDPPPRQITLRGSFVLILFFINNIWNVILEPYRESKSFLIFSFFMSFLSAISLLFPFYYSKSGFFFFFRFHMIAQFVSQTVTN